MNDAFRMPCQEVMSGGIGARANTVLLRLMKVSACHLCGSRNSSPHWCAAPQLYSFSLLLPTFTLSSVKMATQSPATCTPAPFTLHLAALQICLWVISLHTSMYYRPLNIELNISQNTCNCRVSELIEGHWRQFTVHYNNRAAKKKKFLFNLQ